MDSSDPHPERSSRLSPREFGRRAEGVAAAYLQSKGYRVIAANQRVGRGEIDLIVGRAGVLAFVEVKARRTRSCGSPEEAVGVRKRLQVCRLAELWLAARPWALSGVREIRFDIVAVDATVRPVRVRHLPGAFEAG